MIKCFCDICDKHIKNKQINEIKYKGIINICYPHVCNECLNALDKYIKDYRIKSSID